LRQTVFKVGRRLRLITILPSHKKQTAPDQGALRLAASGTEAAGVGRLVALHKGDCADWRPKRTPTFVATNPPWGGRLPTASEGRGGGGGRGERGWQQEGRGGARDRFSGGSGDEEEDGGGWREQREFGGGGGGEDEGAWEGLAAFLKGRCPGAQAWVLSGAPELTRGLGMRSFKKRSVTLGGAKAALLGYDVLPPRERDGWGGAGEREGGEGERGGRS
jgi:23S rRNA G2445 N2-methylase RlmL